MDTPTPVAATDDLSALAWVHEELRKTLEAAHKALRRYLRDAESSKLSDLDDVEPTVLRTARQHLHQGVGALELVNVPEGAMLLRAAETAVQRFVARAGRIDTEGVEHIEQASFALLDYMARRLAGKPAPAVALFPQLRALLELNGAERIHPADLWTYDWRWRDIAPLPPGGDATAAPANPAAIQADFERRLLMLVRSGAPEAAAALARDCVWIAADSANAAGPAGTAATFWRIAAAFFEAWGLGLLTPDLFTKRTASRVMAQLRARSKGDREVSDRLAQDLLFYCARAQAPDATVAPWLDAVRRSWRLSDEAPVDYSTPLFGRFDPTLIHQARRRVNAAKEAWNGVAAGELHRLDSLLEAFSLVGDSLRRLYPAGEHLAQALTGAAIQTGRHARPPAPALAMEVATSLLYLDAALEEAEFDAPGQASRATRLAERIQAAAAGEPPQTLEPWMEELYRRVSDRQTMGSVVQELRAALSDIERQIDQYFRHPHESGLLAQVPHQLVAMRGVLTVLGVDAAVQASARMREDVEALLHGDPDPRQPETVSSFQRLAGNLGALGFLIDMLSVQPQMARSLFRFDASTGLLAPVMGRSAMAPDLIDRAHAIAAAAQSEAVPIQALAAQIDALSREQQIARKPELAASLNAAQQALDRAQPSGVAENLAREHAAQALNDFVATATGPAGLEPLAGPSLVSRPIPLELGEPPKFVPTGLEEDAEMRDVFLEESREVLAQAQTALELLTAAPSDVTQLTTVRRAFHTLKGSARMVGLAAFGEAAWACEQLYNHWLAEQAPANAHLRTLTGDALQYFAAWVAAIAEGHAEAFVPEPLIAAAEALRLAGESMRVPVPGGWAAEPALLDLATDLGGGLDLEVPSESPGMPVLEPLQATQPLELTPIWDNASEAASQNRMPAIADFGIDLDLGDTPALDTSTSPAQFRAEPDEAAAATVAPPLETGEPAAGLDLDLGVVPAGESASAPESGASPRIDLPIDAPIDGPVEPESPPLSAQQVLEAAIDQGNFERIEVSLPEWPADAAPSWRTPLETRTSQLDSRSGVLHGEAGGSDDDSGIAAGPIDEAPFVADVPDQPVAPAAPTVSDPFGAGQVIRLDDFRVPSQVAPLETPNEPTPDAPLDEDDIKVIGPLRLQIPLFNIYLNEADELSRRLSTELTEWALELQRPVGASAVALAHSLAGSSFTVGFEDLAHLARALEHALAQSDRAGRGEPADAALFTEVADEVRRLLHHFAAGFLRSPPEELVQRLNDWQLAATTSRSSAPVGLDLELESAEEVPLPELPPLPTDMQPTQPSQLQALPNEPQHDDLEHRAGDDAAALESPLPDLPASTGSAQGLPGEPAEVASTALPPLTFDLQPVGGIPGPASVTAAPTIQPAPPAESASPFDADIDQEDQIDAELFPIFEEEAEELMPLLSSQLGEWQGHPGDAALATACMRTLHTFKGSARLAGAMRLGELAHRFESAIERLTAAPGTSRADLEDLQHRADHLAAAFEVLRASRGAPSPSTLAVLGALPTPPRWSQATQPAPLASSPPASPAASLPPDTLADRFGAQAWPTTTSPAATLEGLAPQDAAHGAGHSPTDAPAAASAEASSVSSPAGTVRVVQADAPTDWARFLSALPPSRQVQVDRTPANTQPVRVRAPLLDRLVNLAGEVSITRTRLEAEVGQIRSSLADLTDNLERLNQQLHDIALQAETQLESRMEAARAALQEFDPLELDRYTRLQELTRMMAESVNDVATVRSTMQRTLQTTEDELAVQARLTRELQGDLLRTRMIEFESLSERLYRVVRQAAKETGKQVRFDIVGGSIEVDRGVLDRMTAAFEHLLRNCVTHGIEAPEARTAAGKDPTGSIVVTVEQEGNEVNIEIRDDGAGLDLNRIRERAVAMGLLAADAKATDRELANLIMAPGLSTAAALTELAGRGVGMDVVRADVQALGGRVETRTNKGRGTRFKLVLPLTTVVTQVVILRAADRSIAVPSNLVELVQRVAPETIAEAYDSGAYSYGGLDLPFYWLGALLQTSARGSELGRTLPVVIVRSAQQRVALHVDEVLGSHEVVVKNLGPQLSSLPGLAGMTLLPSGTVALIYNPVALASIYGPSAQSSMHGSPAGDIAAEPETPHRPAPLVLVVDDSLTVRRITKRLLEREGLRVAMAKDGLEALEVLSGELPSVVLSDIEMPRMDGFDLLRNIRGDAIMRQLPVIMITSRIAQKHRDIALELGANHYLGKPYRDEELLALIRHYVAMPRVSVDA